MATLIRGAERPNVVVLLADDLGSRDISCYGGPVETPAIDQLAARGIRFETFYSGAPVCSTARAVLLTGRQHLRTGVYTVIQDHMHDMHLLRRETTLAEHLKANGYQTAHFGKWHLGTPFRGREKPWIDEHGFEYWFATDLNAAPSHRNPTNFWRNRKPVGPLEGYACDLVADEAINWLATMNSKEQPFFLNVWFHEPHAPLAAPDTIVEQYGAAGDPAAIYSATIANTDRAIGRLVEKLEELGQLQNTIIFYTSDHGSYRPERNGALRGNKGSLFEGGIRTPGIFFWPKGIRSDYVESEFGAAVDLLPTICGLVGIEPPANVRLDGIDLSPLLRGTGIVERKQPLFWASPTSQPVTAIRDGNHVLVGYRQSEYPKDQARIDELLADMNHILEEELQPDKVFSASELWRNAWNFESQRDDWKKLRSEFVLLNTFQESWCKLIQQGSGAPNRFELYDLANDPNQTQDIAYQQPVLFAKLKQQATALYDESVKEAVDWSDPDHVVAAEQRNLSIEEAMRIHRLDSTYRSVFDAFTYVNRIPEEPFSDESAEDLSARIFSRLANQEGRILLKAPPGMSADAYAGYKIFLRYEGEQQVGNCGACHVPRSFTDQKSHIVVRGEKPKPTPSLRNSKLQESDIRKILAEKIQSATLRKTGQAEGVSKAFQAIELSKSDVESLIKFLRLLQDVPADQFRDLILEAKVAVSFSDEDLGPNQLEN